MHRLSDEHPNVKGMAVLAVWSIKDKRSTALSILQIRKVTERVIWQESLNVLSRCPIQSVRDSVPNREDRDGRQTAVGGELPNLASQY